jgi:hypothetical protein
LLATEVDWRCFCARMMGRKLICKLTAALMKRTWRMMLIMNIFELVQF